MIFTTFSHPQKSIFLTPPPKNFFHNEHPQTQNTSAVPVSEQFLYKFFGRLFFIILIIMQLA